MEGGRRKWHGHPGTGLAACMCVCVSVSMCVCACVWGVSSATAGGGDVWCLSLQLTEAG